MQCPPEIASIIAEILRTGLLRVRTSQNLERARLEADHLHNLPTLLVDFRPVLLDFYWGVERTCFIERSSPEETEQFLPLWKALSVHFKAANENALARCE